MSTRHLGFDFKLILRKNVFSYDYFDSFDTFDDFQLLSRKEFYSTFLGVECAAEYYDYAQRVWMAFGCTSLEDYLKLYLASHVC